ncbi:MAG: GIY-YIG nuclease family protein [Bacteroidota bacterium]
MTAGYGSILTNKKKTVLYVGATSNLERRIQEHRNRKYENAFTGRYNCYHLVYFEEFEDISAAFTREKQLKAGNRRRKDSLINSINPEWNDLSEKWFGKKIDSK